LSTIRLGIFILAFLDLVTLLIYAIYDII